MPCAARATVVKSHVHGLVRALFRDCFGTSYTQIYATTITVPVREVVNY